MFLPIVSTAPAATFNYLTTLTEGKAYTRAVFSDNDYIYGANRQYINREVIQS